MKDLPQLPPDIKPNPNLVYLGTGGKNLVFHNYKKPYYIYQEELGIWESGYVGYFGSHHYAIEFGTTEWNRWAEKRYNLDPIPEGAVFVGNNPEEIGIKDFFGRHTQMRDGILTWGMTPTIFHKITSNVSQDLHPYYSISKTDPQLAKVKEYYCGAPEVAPEIVINVADLSVYVKYKEACKELEEAKSNNSRIQRRGYLTRGISDNAHIIIKDDEVYFGVNGNFSLWSKCEIIQPPAFEIEVNVNDTGSCTKPITWTKSCWVFEGETISFDMITRLYNFLPSVVTSFKIGRGNFTTDLIKELYEHQCN